MSKLRSILLILLLAFSCFSYAQDDQIVAEEFTDFDYWLIMGNKVVFGGQNRWKHSHEIQWRASDNVRALNTIFYEAVVTYSPNEQIEFVPDFRYSRRPLGREFRPGMGIVFKKTWKERKLQFVQQVKWQADIRDYASNSQAMRYVPTVNKVINDKYVVGLIAAVLYQWGSDFDDRFNFVRYGPSVGIVFDQVHTLNFTPAFGAENLGDGLWRHSFTPIFQLILRVNKEYKYVPARYINF